MYDRFFKRVSDFVISVILLVLVSPILLVLVILVKSDSPGPFIFSTTRIGRNSQKFIIYKIRTMRESAGIAANDERQPYITTMENDERITKIGSILRRFHLDELPQLINVMLGDMSIVGVRPDAPTQIDDYKDYVWTNRHLMRPGITGLSQIHSSDLGFDFSSRNKYDLYYVKRKKKFWLDLYILWKTVLKIIRGNSL
ncbi:sugar transferase [Pseudomonadales bacterium]|nr:sugar transferase [Pseudomonadales bacterium]